MSENGSMSGEGEEGSGHRAGFVALLGPPNAGKSSLLNHVIGERLAIVTAKPQTTRSRILGILNRPGAQLMFLDTPGLHTSPKKLNAALNDAVEAAARDCDVALVLVDRTSGWTDAHVDLVAGLRETKKPYLVVGTKSDLPRAAAGVWPPPEADPEVAALSISARTGEGIEELLSRVEAALPECPPLYPADTLTDRPIRWLCGELVREAAFELLSKEIPYVVAVDVIRYDETQPDITVIHANILVERNSQKRIVVGQGGEMIKKIGTRSRKAMQKLIDGKVYLQLFVKVDPKWLKSGRRIEELGYK